MSISIYIYHILYITVMVAIFGLSLVMLLPRTRVAFKAPVPHIHDALGKIFIPWGMSYLLFLPCMYMQITDDERTGYVYVVTSMVTALMTISVTSWAYMAYLQQGVRQKILQPLFLLAPTVLTIWYAVDPSETLLNAFNGIFTLEWMLLAVYYIVLYRRFAHDLKVNYSSISSSMLHGLHVQWAMSIITLIVFTLCVTYDSLLWNSINILVNAIAAAVFVYTSEHMMPIPEKDEEFPTASPNEDERQSVDDTITSTDSNNQGINIAEALRNECEAKQLFCNPDLTLADLALAIGTNRTYLGEWFTDNDTTFYQYINTLRIRHAADLLLTTDKTIKEIQIESGFSSRTTFSKYFAEYHGCSPTVYRQKK